MAPVVQTTEGETPAAVDGPVPAHGAAESGGNGVVQNKNILNQIENKNRRTQNVSTLQMRYEVITWMREQEAAGEQNIPMKAIEEFPPAFLGVQTANRVKARRWWRQRNSPDLLKYTKIAVVGGRARRKAMPGRGRKPPAWVSALYTDVMETVNELEEKGERMSVKEVRALALRIAAANPEKYDMGAIENKINMRVIRKFFKMREDARNNEVRHRYLEDEKEEDVGEVQPQVAKPEVDGEVDPNIVSQQCVEILDNGSDSVFVEDPVL